MGKRKEVGIICSEIEVQIVGAIKEMYESYDEFTDSVKEFSKKFQ